MKYIALLIALFLSFQGSTQNSWPVVRTFEGSKPLNQMDSFYLENKILDVSLDGGFDDSIQVYINDTLIFSTFAKSNMSIDFAKGFSVPHIDRGKSLTIWFPNSGVRLKEELTSRYAYLGIWKYKDHFQLVYYNRSFIRE